MPERSDRVSASCIPASGARSANAAARLTPSRRQTLGIREPYAAYVGNLELRKNVDVLFKAFALVRNVHPGAQLVVVGAPGVGWDAISARHENADRQ